MRIIDEGGPKEINFQAKTVVCGWLRPVSRSSPRNYIILWSSVGPLISLSLECYLLSCVSDVTCRDIFSPIEYSTIHLCVRYSTVLIEIVLLRTLWVQCRDISRSYNHTCVGRYYYLFVRRGLSLVFACASNACKKNQCSIQPVSIHRPHAGYVPWIVWSLDTWLRALVYLWPLWDAKRGGR